MRARIGLGEGDRREGYGGVERDMEGWRGIWRDGERGILGEG